MPAKAAVLYLQQKYIDELKVYRRCKYQINCLEVLIQGKNAKNLYEETDFEAQTTSNDNRTGKEIINTLLRKRGDGK